MNLLPYELALIAAVALLIVELLTGTLVCLGFCLGALAVAATEAATGAFRLGRDTLIFAAVATAAIVTLRLLFGRSSTSRKAVGDVNEY